MRGWHTALAPDISLRVPDRWLERIKFALLLRLAHRPGFVDQIENVSCMQDGIMMGLLAHQPYASRCPTLAGLPSGSRRIETASWSCNFYHMSKCTPGATSIRLNQQPSP